jgi:hypothetical protein
MLLVHVDVERCRRQQEENSGRHRRDGAAKIGGAPAEKADQRRDASITTNSAISADDQDAATSACGVVASGEGRAHGAEVIHELLDSPRIECGIGFPCVQYRIGCGLAVDLDSHVLPPCRPLGAGDFSRGCRTGLPRVSIETDPG